LPSGGDQKKKLKKKYPGGVEEGRGAGLNRTPVKVRRFDRNVRGLCRKRVDFTGAKVGGGGGGVWFGDSVQVERSRYSGISPTQVDESQKEGKRVGEGGLSVDAARKKGVDGCFSCRAKKRLTCQRKGEVLLVQRKILNTRKIKRSNRSAQHER